MSSYKSIQFVTIILIVCCFYYCRNQTINNKMQSYAPTSCPQNSIDAITLFSNNTLLIFQKNHVWIKLMDSIKTSQLIQNHWSGRYKQFQSDFDDIIYNPREELTLIFKAKYFFVTFHSTLANDQYLLQNITNYFETIHDDQQTPIDAAILVEDSNNDCLQYKCLIIHLFKDKFLWSYKWYHFWHIQPINDYPIDLTTIHYKFPTHLDAAFSDNNYIYLIKGLNYYKILLKRFPRKVSNEDLAPHLLYVDIIKCKYIGNYDTRLTSNNLANNQFTQNSEQKIKRRIDSNDEFITNNVNIKLKHISTPSVIVDSDNFNIINSTFDLYDKNATNESNVSIDPNMNGATIDSIITSTTIYSNLNINATIDFIMNDKIYSNTETDSTINNATFDSIINTTIESISLNNSKSINDKFETILVLEPENNKSLDSLIVSAIESTTRLKISETSSDTTEKTANKVTNQLQEESRDETAIKATESVTIKSLTTTETGVTIDSIINESINSTEISIRDYLSTNDFEINDESNDKLNLVALITFIAILLIISFSLTVCYIKIRLNRRSYDVRDN